MRSFPDTVWWFAIQSEPNWLSSYSDRPCGIDIDIIRDCDDGQPDQLFFSSPHLSGLTDPQDVVNRAAALKALFDGGVRLYRKGDYTPFSLGRLINVKTDETFHVTPDDPCVAPFSATCGDWLYTAFQSPLTHAYARFLFLCRYDDVSRDIGQDFGLNGMTWITLYAFLDSLKSVGWDDATITRETGITASQLTSIRGTANNRSASGFQSRHGLTAQSTGKAFKHVISLADAAAIIAVIAVAFFKHRDDLFDVNEKWRDLITV